MKFIKDKKIIVSGICGIAIGIALTFIFLFLLVALTPESNQAVSSNNVQQQEDQTQETESSYSSQYDLPPITFDNETTKESDPKPTFEQSQALQKAKNYLDYTAFSYTGLIEQLEYEGFSHEAATYGADNCNADWYEQAILSAKNYLAYTSFSYQGLIDQLIYTGFTEDQATKAVEQVYN